MNQKSLGSSQDAAKQLQISHWARVIRGRDVSSYSTPAKLAVAFGGEHLRVREKEYEVQGIEHNRIRYKNNQKQYHYVLNIFYYFYTPLLTNCYIFTIKMKYTN